MSFPSLNAIRKPRNRMKNSFVFFGEIIEKSLKVSFETILVTISHFNSGLSPESKQNCDKKHFLSNHFHI